MTEDSGERHFPGEGFVAFLKGLAASEDRGALAVLRRGLGREETPDAACLRLVVPRLPAETWKHPWYYLIAGLFALHPAAGGSGNLGEVFRRLGDHESAQKRFVALLNSRVDDVPHRLRQAVSLARSNDVPVDWGQLLRDLLHWGNESKFVQHAWARSYWGTSGEETNQENQVAPAASAEKGD
jgi:CRISPR system Cascade subunit CasB